MDDGDIKWVIPTIVILIIGLSISVICNVKSCDEIKNYQQYTNSVLLERVDIKNTLAKVEDSISCLCATTCIAHTSAKPTECLDLCNTAIQQSNERCKVYLECK
jgi:hypothetical protein